MENMRGPQVLLVTGPPLRRPYSRVRLHNWRDNRVLLVVPTRLSLEPRNDHVMSHLKRGGDYEWDERIREKQRLQQLCPVSPKVLQ